VSSVPKHRGDNSDFSKPFRLECVGVTVEHDEVGAIARQQLAAPVLVAREPRWVDRCRPERLFEREPLLRVPNTRHAGHVLPGQELRMLDARP